MVRIYKIFVVVVVVETFFWNRNSAINLILGKSFGRKYTTPYNKIKINISIQPILDYP